MSDFIENNIENNNNNLNTIFQKHRKISIVLEVISLLFFCHVCFSPMLELNNIKLPSVFDNARSFFKNNKMPSFKDLTFGVSHNDNIKLSAITNIAVLLFTCIILRASILIKKLQFKKTFSSNKLFMYYCDAIISNIETLLLLAVTSYTFFRFNNLKYGYSNKTSAFFLLLVFTINLISDFILPILVFAKINKTNYSYNNNTKKKSLHIIIIYDVICCIISIALFFTIIIINPSKKNTDEIDNYTYSFYAKQVDDNWENIVFYNGSNYSLEMISETELSFLKECFDNGYESKEKTLTFYDDTYNFYNEIISDLKNENEKLVNNALYNTTDIENNIKKIEDNNKQIDYFQKLLNNCEYHYFTLTIRVEKTMKTTNTSQSSNRWQITNITIKYYTHTVN